MAKTDVATFVAETLDEMPIAGFHRRVMVLIIGGLFFDLFDVAILGSLAPDIIASHFAKPEEVAFVASATFLGLLLGSVIQGELTDRYGRKTIYQANLLIYGLATLASGLSPHYLVFAALRFVAGLGLGAEIPLAYAYAAEFAPRRTRGRVMATVNFVGGCMPFPLAILFALAFRNVLGWQGVFAAIGVAALAVFVFRFSLPESPRWLAANGRDRAALDVMRSLGVSVPPTLAVAPEHAAPIRTNPLMVVLTCYTRRVTALMFALFAAFAALYALVTWLPTLMSAQGFSITKSLTFVLVMTTAFPLSGLILTVILDRIGRIATTVGSFVLAGALAVAFMNSTSETMILINGFLMSLFTVNAANTLEILCGELFPSDARSSGSGLGFGAGRLGAAAASYVAITLLNVYGPNGVFVAIALTLGVGAVSSLLLGQEPAGLALDTIAPVRMKRRPDSRDRLDNDTGKRVADMAPLG